MDKTFTLRIDSQLWGKFKKIAETNRRSANNQLELLVADFVVGFEKENGEISLDSAE